MKKLIENDDDVRLLVRSFYDKVFQDEMLSPFFAHAVNNNWEEHLKTIDSFWSNVIFYTGGYVGNPLEIHKKLHHFKPLNKENFERWLMLFNETVDELFEGEKAELAKQRAYSIATVMQIKILN
jgi:hemoglobin